MCRILAKRMLGLHIHEYVIEAPDIARAARAGQFVVLCLHEHGERIPLTIVESIPELEAIKPVVQELGKTTREMHEKFHEGGSILDPAGPLGEPSKIENFGTVRHARHTRVTSGTGPDATGIILHLNIPT